MLRKDDPVYYKVKINQLIKQAKENELIVCFDSKNNCLSFKCTENNEQASVCLDSLIIEQKPKELEYN